MKKCCLLSLCLAIGGVFAEPVQLGTRSELFAAREVVKELVDSGAGVDELLSMATKSEKAPERFWLYSNAFILQVKSGKHAEATATLKTFRENVLGIEDSDLIGLIERYAKDGVAKSPELAAILKEAKSRVSAQKLVPQLRVSVRRNPKDDELKIRLAEALAVSGDWKAALKILVETKGAAKYAAQAELEHDPTMKTAAFWWSHEPCRPFSTSKVFKKHAAEIYKSLLQEGELSDIEKALAEKRIALIPMAEVPSTTETGSDSVEEVVSQDKSSKVTPLYLLVDVSGGPQAEKYPVSWLRAEPRGGWTKEHKTTKIVLRRIDAGEYIVQGGVKVKLSRPFYIGVFEVTQRQYELVMGVNPSEFKSDATGNVAACRPVERVSWSTIRGGVSTGTEITASSPDSFMKRLVTKTGLPGFDLPIEVQWEIACRAGSSSEYGSFLNGASVESVTLSKLGKVAWYKDNSASTTHAVGGKRPNPWGLYDMQGNVSEWCRDIFLKEFDVSYVDGPCTDHSFDSGKERVIRGGGWSYNSEACQPGLHGDFGWKGWGGFTHVGFRLSKSCP